MMLDTRQATKLDNVQNRGKDKRQGVGDRHGDADAVERREAGEGRKPLGQDEHQRAGPCMRIEQADGV